MGGSWNGRDPDHSALEIRGLRPMMAVFSQGVRGNSPLRPGVGEWVKSSSWTWALYSRAAELTGIGSSTSSFSSRKPTSKYLSTQVTAT